MSARGQLLDSAISGGADDQALALIERIRLDGFEVMGRGDEVLLRPGEFATGGIVRAIEALHADVLRALHAEALTRRALAKVGRQGDARRKNRP